MYLRPKEKVNRFETILADTKQARDLHFRFRFKVFCEETGFEQASEFPDGRERDAYDDFSVHFIVWDHLNGEVAGAMRLVDAAESSLPIEDITGNRGLVPSRARNRFFEFSRLCIDRRYYRIHRSEQVGIRRSTETGSGDEVPVIYSQEDNEILLRLVRAFGGWSELNGKDGCFFLTTKALARVLQRQKVVLEAAGSGVNHRGNRIPYFADIAEGRKEMEAGNPAFVRLSNSCEAFVNASTLPPLCNADSVASLPVDASRVPAKPAKPAEEGANPPQLRLIDCRLREQETAGTKRSTSHRSFERRVALQSNM